MLNCYTVQGRLHNIGMMVGGGLRDPNCVDSRQRLFQVYRLLNLIHTLVYMDHTLEMTEFNYDDLLRIGLLTQSECDAFAPFSTYCKCYIRNDANEQLKRSECNECMQSRPGVTKNKAQEMACSWLTNVVMNLVNDEKVHKFEVCKHLCELRGACATHEDLFVRCSPNVYVSTMVLTVDYLIVLVVMGIPFTACIYVPGQGAAFQPLVIFCSFLMLSALLLANALAYILRDPFLTEQREGSVYNQAGMKMDGVIDCRALLHSTDCALFALLRANFANIDHNIDRAKDRRCEESSLVSEFKSS